MRIIPELLDHPKLIKLQKAVGDCALMHLMRIWGHCESNQKGEFWDGADPEYVEIVARWNGENGVLYAALVKCGFVDVVYNGVIIHDWNETNSRAVSNWSTGRKGGRPRKDAKPNDNPTETVSKPNDNPTETIGISYGNPMQTLMSEGMSERMSEEDDVSHGIDPNPSRPSARSRGILVDAEHIAELKKIYRAADVDRAYARMQAWLLTPKGESCLPTRRRFVTFLKDCEPIAVSVGAEKKEKTGPKIPDNWRELAEKCGYELTEEFRELDLLMDQKMLGEIFSAAEVEQ